MLLTQWYTWLYVTGGLSKAVVPVCLLVPVPVPVLELMSMLLLQVVRNLWGNPSGRWGGGLLCDRGPGGLLEKGL